MGRRHYSAQSSDSVEYVNKLRIFPDAYGRTEAVIIGNT